MTRLRIQHETIYRYGQPVSFGDWRLMMRPLDSHSIRVLEAKFVLTPPGETRWTSDAYSNSVCHFTPAGRSNLLSVVSTLLIERYPKPLRDAESVAPLMPAGAMAPAVIYSNEDAAVLAPFIRPFYAEHPVHSSWLWRQQRQQGDTALDVLLRINRAVHDDFRYGARDEYGTQTPAQTIARGAGTCRDFAWLMIESVRRWGFAARFVTGYLYSPALDGSMRGAGATHAWCEVFLPDLGWLEFDPTNGLSESPELIRVAATRTPGEASPMTGVVMGDAVATMEVFVSVTLDNSPAPMPV
ncbi:MAG TPA: transglutaminase family protein [Caulobacterales bacterium]|nr:transglutaminase family protein [Caulobacterales bacterium]